MNVDITSHVETNVTISASPVDLADIVAGLTSDEQALFLSSLTYRLKSLGAPKYGYQLAWIAEALKRRPSGRDAVVDFLLDLNGYIEGEPS